MGEKYFTMLTFVLLMVLAALAVDVRQRIIIQGEELNTIAPVLTRQQSRQAEMAAQYAGQVAVYEKRTQDYDQVMQQYKEKVKEYEQITAEYKRMMAEYQEIIAEYKKQNQGLLPEQPQE